MKEYFLGALVFGGAKFLADKWVKKSKLTQNTTDDLISKLLSDFFGYISPFKNKKK